MRICEQFIAGKFYDPRLCEDDLVVLPDGLAVIDGVTAKRPNVSNLPSGGRRACEILKRAMPSAIKEADPFKMLQRLNRALADERDKSGGLKASVIVYQAAFQRVVNYGDCQCIIDGNLYRHAKTIDKLNAQKRSRIIKKALHAGVSRDELLHNDVGREAIFNDLISQERFENDPDSEFGFPVLNGGNLQESMMRIYSADPCDEVILATDGYPELKDTLAKSEKALATILAEDPLLIQGRYASTKGVLPGNRSFDDRCYVRLYA